MIDLTKRGCAAPLLIVAALAVAVAETTPAETGGSEKTLKVERQEPDKKAASTLVYLHANRDFFRARLDRLREVYGTAEDGNAVAFDQRYLKLLEMLADAKAARDSTAAGERELAQTDFLQSLSDLEWLELELARMEDLLDRQEERLAWLEEDFAGSQTTSLMIFLRGFPVDGKGPDGIVLEADGTETVRVALDSATCASLLRGGLVQVYHKRVEPRGHQIEVGFEGNDWTTLNPATLSVETARNRLTLLELNLAELRREEDLLKFDTHAWVK